MLQFHFSRLIIQLCIFCLCAVSLTAQTCFPDGIHLNSQDQIDNFSTYYPGCTIIEGSIIIGDPESPYDDTDIQNLEGLSQITAVKGNILISGTEHLKSLEGLENLTVIEGDLEIKANKELNSVKGLDNISLIKGSLILTLNCSCLQLTGLENLEVIRGDFNIMFGSFNGLNPLNKIDSIYGDFRAYNSNFTNFAGVNTL